jgi:hypothetical protein
MNTSGKLADLVGSEAWDVAAESRRAIGEPRIMFCLDDGHTVSMLFKEIGQAAETGETLVIEFGESKIEIFGPKVKALHRDFCRGYATMIKSDGIDIVSVKLLAL